MSDIIKIIDNENETLDIVNGKLQTQSPTCDELQTTSNELLTDVKANQTNGTQATKFVDEAGNPAEVDDSTHTLQTIEYEHH